MDLNLVYPDSRTVPVSIGPVIGTGQHALIRLVLDLPDIVVKTFYQTTRHNAARRRYLTRKLEAMTATTAPDPSRNADIAWPTAIAYNTDNELVGYAMPRLQANLTPLRNSDNGAWHPAAQTAIATTIPILHRLHLQDIVIGDISTGNILADPTGQHIGLVDCDGWQFRDPKDNRLYIAEGWTHPYIPPSIRTPNRQQTMSNCINPDCPHAGIIHVQRPYGCHPRLPQHDLEALDIMSRRHALSSRALL